MEIILHLIFSQQSFRSKRDKIVFMENWWINNDFFKKKIENPCLISSIYLLDDLNLALASFTSLSLSVNACNYSCSLPHTDASSINEIMFIVQWGKILGVQKISLVQSSSFPWKSVVIPCVYIQSYWRIKFFHRTDYFFQKIGIYPI